MLEIRSLTKTYGGRPALDDLSVAIRPGTVTGRLHLNGAGKTTHHAPSVLGLARSDRDTTRH